MLRSIRTIIREHTPEMGAVRRTAPSTHTAVQTEAHIATAQQQF
jgi:hypothetical protein